MTAASKVPDEWDLTPLKYLLRESDIRGLTGEMVLSVYRDHGVIPKASRDDNFNRTPENLNNYKLVRTGDLVVNKMKAWQGSVAVSDYRGIVSGDYLVAEFTSDIEGRYYHYTLRSLPFVHQYRMRSTGVRPAQWRLYWQGLREIEVPIPPRLAQTVIADFLDRETERIDRLVEKKRRMIELLEEKRTALVNHAVTKGLDPTIPMRDSGIPWIGKMPQSWSLAKVGHVCTLVNGYPLPSVGFNDSKGVPVIRIRDLLNGFTGTYFEGELARVPRIEEGDLIVGMDGQFNAALWTGPAALLNQRVCSLRPGNGVELKYIFYALPYPLQVVNDLTPETTVKHLASSTLLSQWIPLPNLQEQREISHKLDVRVGHLQRAMLLLTEQLDKLAEYRQALITAAVTGQIDIGAEQKDPEEVVA